MPDLFSYCLLNIPTVFKDETIEGVKGEQTSLDLDLLNFCHHLQNIFHKGFILISCLPERGCKDPTGPEASLQGSCLV